MQKLQDEKLLRKIFFIFLMVQPVLDCYLLYTDEIINIFHFSPTTIIRMLIIAFLFVLIFFNKKNFKNLKIIGIYGGFIIAYILAHHFISSGIDNSGYKTFSYSIVTELLYMVRMLLPIAVIMITYKLKPTKEDIIKLFLIVSAITSGIIIVLNFLNVACASYGGGFIKASFFEWFFNKEYTPYDLASKGWFNSANQISGLMFILFPICLYSLCEKITKSRIIITIMVLLSMIMLGTRVASYGWILIMGMMIVLYLFYSFIFKTNKFEWKKFGLILLILALGLVLMIKAPIVNTGTNYSDEDEKKMKSLKSGKDLEEKLKYSGTHPSYYKEIYPYKDHKEFWIYVVEKVSPEKRVGNRNSQNLITNDIGKTYENVSTSLFGLGYSRFINAYLYLEKDFVVHYYTIGIFGIILLLCPYILIAGYFMFQKIKKKKFILFDIIILATLILPLCISYFSGHIIDELIISLYLGFIAGYLLYDSRKEIENGQS